MSLPQLSGTTCSTCGGRGWHTAGGNEPSACGACPAGEAWYGDATDRCPKCGGDPSQDLQTGQDPCWCGVTLVMK